MYNVYKKHIYKKYLLIICEHHKVHFISNHKSNYKALFKVYGIIYMNMCDVEMSKFTQFLQICACVHKTKYHT